MMTSVLDDVSPPRGVPFPIVGIGASAGGLEAFTQMLRVLPADTGMAFVFIQHLDPHHESQLQPILSGLTGMAVQTADDGVKVVPNHIYVLPQAAMVALRQGALHLTPREPGMYLPIDVFFRSLATEQGSRSIGVVLSGNASDGSQGLLAIKRCSNSIWAAGSPLGIPEASACCSYRENEIVGQPAALLFTPEDVDRGEHIKEMETARREGRAEDERCHIRKDGTRFWSSGVVTLVRDDAGIPRGYAKVMRDITERKQMEEELRATLSEKDVLIKYQPAELTVRAHCGPEGEGEFGADQEPGARHCHHP